VNFRAPIDRLCNALSSDFGRRSLQLPPPLLNFQSDISSAEWQVGIAIDMMIVLADRSWLTFGADFSLDLENSPVDGLPTGVVVGGIEHVTLHSSNSAVM
jgi:hypothetical protein